MVIYLSEFDYVLMILMVVIAIFASFKGFVGECASLLSFVGASICAYVFGSVLMNFMLSSIHLRVFSWFLSYGLIFLISSILISIFVKKNLKVMELDSFLSGFLGFWMGFLKALFLLFLGFMLLNKFIAFEYQPMWLKDSTIKRVLSMN